MSFDRSLYPVVPSLQQSAQRAWAIKRLHDERAMDRLAALQSFPDGFVFCGPSSSGKKGTGRRKRIGNAVPPWAARVLALEIRLALEAADAGAMLLSNQDVWVMPQEGLAA